MLILGEGLGISACQELKEFNWYCTNGLVPKDARACICTYLEHHFIDDDPFQPVQQWFNWNYISKYSYFFFMNCYLVKRYSHHVEDTGRPFSWIHIDNHGQFISQPAIWQLTADICNPPPPNVILTISGRVCVKHMSKLSEARGLWLRRRRHIGIGGRPQPYFGKSDGWDLCHGSHSR